MNLESLKNLDKKYAQAIANYLLGRIETDELLKTKLEETTKTLKGCVDYAKSEAKKQAEDGVAMIEDSQVYDWCVHYFLEDNIDFEPKEKENKEDKIIARTKENSLEKEYKSNYSISFVINNLTSILALIDRKECDVNYTSETNPITFFNYNENYILIPCRVGE